MKAANRKYVCIQGRNGSDKLAALPYDKLIILIERSGLGQKDNPDTYCLSDHKELNLDFFSVISFSFHFAPYRTITLDNINGDYRAT